MQPLVIRDCFLVARNRLDPKPVSQHSVRVVSMSEHQSDAAELETLKQRFLEMVERDPEPDVATLFDEVIRRRFGTAIARAALNIRPKK